MEVVLRSLSKIILARYEMTKILQMGWPGTECIFSAVKRKFGENCVSRSREGLEAEGYQRICIYDHINQRAKRAIMALN